MVGFLPEQDSSVSIFVEMNVHRRNILCLIELDFAAGADDQLFVGDDIKGFVTQTDGLDKASEQKINADTNKWESPKLP